MAWGYERGVGSEIICILDLTVSATVVLRAFISRQSICAST